MTRTLLLTTLFTSAVSTLLAGCNPAGDSPPDTGTCDHLCDDSEDSGDPIDDEDSGDPIDSEDTSEPVDTEDTGAAGELDSDGDGYTDAEELHAGSDPDDANSVIYEGGWPYNLGKGTLAESAWYEAPDLGTQMPPFSLVDQFGELVDLYDFAGQGKPTILDIGGPNCGACQSMAAFISDGNLEHMTYKGGEHAGELYSWWKPEYNQIPELVANGEIQWISVLAWSLSYTYPSPVTPEHASAWAEAYPSDKVPALADTDAALSTYINRTGTPILILLDENFEFLTHFGPQTSGSAFSVLLAEGGPLN